MKPQTFGLENYPFAEVFKHLHSFMTFLYFQIQILKALQTTIAVYYASRLL